MPQSRTVLALALALGAALAVDLVGGGASAALIALVGGVAVALLAGAPADEGVLPPPLPASDNTEPPLGQVLDAIVEPVLVIEAGRVTLANAAARALLGQHIVGEDARLAIRHPAGQERLLDPASGRNPVDLVGLGRLDQRWQMRVAAAEGHRVVHLIDQTGNYAAERMRVDFVANASHELRTPLASILGYVETLREGAGEDEAIRTRFLKVIFGEARRMQRLVEDLISLSRIEAEKYRLPEHAVDLGDLLEQVHDELVDSGDPRGRDIALDFAPDLPPVTGDAAQLSQLLHNLIGNAMKYGRAGTPVSVRLWQQDGETLRILVADEGDGIAPEHLPRLTERFYRVDPGRSRSLGGTGLGLAIVKHIVERHRGRMDISSSIGRGTTVTVVLPAAGVTKG